MLIAVYVELKVCSGFSLFPLHKTAISAVTWLYVHNKEVAKFSILWRGSKDFKKKVGTLKKAEETLNRERSSHKDPWKKKTIIMVFSSSSCRAYKSQ